MYFQLLVFSVLVVGSYQYGHIYPPAPVGIKNQKFLIKVIGFENDLTDCNFIRHTHYYQQFNDQYYYDQIDYSCAISKSDNKGCYPGANFYWEEIGQCGIQFSPLSSEHEGTWEVNVFSKNGSSHNLDFVMKVLDEPSYTSRQILVKVGRSVSEKCATDHDAHPIYVKIYNPKNELHDEGPNVQLDIPFFRKQDEGLWTCKVLFKNQYAESTITLDLREYSSLKGTKNETEGEINLLWTSYDSLERPCYFERPDGLMMNLLEGVIYPNFTYFGLGADARQCGVSIPKPLRKEDYGSWKVIVGTPERGMEYISGFIEIPEDKSEKSKRVGAHALPENINLVRGSRLTVKCMARSSLSYCYLKSPSGVIYNAYEGNPDVQYTGEMGLDGGECTITVSGNLLNTTDSGTWLCGMGVDKASDDLQIPVKVKIAENVFFSTKAEVTGDLGSPLQIHCRSFHNNSLRYCKFNRPDGFDIVSFGQKNSINSKYSYVGDGLESGHCGLNITQLEMQDLGVWKCRTKFIGQEEEYLDEVMVNQIKGLV